MEKISSFFWVHENYVVEKNNNIEEFDKATVILEISYRTKSYSVKSYSGSQGGLFDFRFACNKPGLSNAVAKAIIKAIKFAEQELKNNE